MHWPSALYRDHIVLLHQLWSGEKWPLSTLHPSNPVIAVSVAAAFYIASGLMRKRNWLTWAVWMLDTVYKRHPFRR